MTPSSSSPSGGIIDDFLDGYAPRERPLTQSDLKLLSEGLEQFLLDEWWLRQESPESLVSDCLAALSDRARDDLRLDEMLQPLIGAINRLVARAVRSECSLHIQREHTVMLSHERARLREALDKAKLGS